MIKLKLAAFILVPLALNSLSLRKPEKFDEYALVWSDEFNTDGKLDEKIWSYEGGFVRNEELQWYQADNAYCKGGNLIIEARQQTIANQEYMEGSTNWKTNRKEATITSACVITKGNKEFKYGRFEVRAKIPLISGSWPAIWTLGSNMPWPSCGEIDLMEYYRIGGIPHILANAAWGSNKPNEAIWDSAKIPFKHFTDKDKNWGDKFHIWKMDWNEQFIRLYLDDELLNEISLSETTNEIAGNKTNQFKQPHYILLNLAIGGLNGGEPDLTSFPLKYSIDYIRVYQKRKS